MSEKATPNESAPVSDTALPAEEATPSSPTPPTPPTPPRRSPGHRGQDVRDTVAELAARAHEISLEAGSKMSGALKDVINAAAGLTAFAVESARDLVQYMVRRGQMTQEEADKLIREAEEASHKRPKPSAKTETAKSRPPAAPKEAAASAPKPSVKAAAAPSKKAAQAARKPSSKTTPKKPAAKK